MVIGSFLTQIFKEGKNIPHIIKNFRNLHTINSVQNFDKSKLLFTINNSSENDLYELGLSPNLIKTLIYARKNAGEVSDISHLKTFGIDGKKAFVLGKAANGNSLPASILQNIIQEQSKDLSFTNSDADDQGDMNVVNSDVNSLKKKLKSIKKQFYIAYPSLRKDISVITSLYISYGCLSWATMDVNWSLTDIGCAELFPVEDSKKLLQALDSFAMFQKLSEALEYLPKTDIVVFSSTRSSSTFDALESKFIYFLKGALPALLDDRRTSGSVYHPLVFFNESVVSTLFNLKVGNERISGMEIGERFLLGRPSKSWFPTIHPEPKALEKYILSDYSEKRLMIESLLIAVAFNSVIVNNLLDIQDVKR